MCRKESLDRKNEEEEKLKEVQWLRVNDESYAEERT